MLMLPPLTRFKEIAGPAGAVAATAAIFALMHVGRSDFSPLTVPQYFVDGMFLGGVTLQTGDIWSAVGFHFAKNLLVALLLGGTLVAFGEPLLTPITSASAPISATADMIAYLVSMPIGGMALSVTGPSHRQLTSLDIIAAASCNKCAIRLQGGGKNRHKFDVMALAREVQVLEYWNVELLDE